MIKLITLFIILTFYLLNISNFYTLENKKFSSYVPLKKFLKINTSIQLDFDLLSLIFELKYKLNKIRMEVDSSFYIHNGQQITINLPPLYHNNQIYLHKNIIKSFRKKLKIKKNIVRKKKGTKKFSNKKIKLKPHYKKNSNSRIKKYPHLNFIIIDPGHGGRDPGAKGYNNVLEKEITLFASKKLAKYLKIKFSNTKIILTRRKDKFISLEKRSKIANRYYSKKNFGIFLSLHCNATFTPRSHGFEIYYLDRSPSNENVRLLMLRENLFLRSTKYARKFTSYLVDAQIQRESKTLALEIHRAFSSNLKGLVSSRGIRRADFSVMRSVSMPALLIEMGYITNAHEANVLKSNRFFKKMGQAIAHGIKLFLKRRPRI